MMNTIIKSTFFLLLFLPRIVVNAQDANRVLFSNNWRFKLDSVQQFEGPELEDSTWRKLNLPHDWSIEGEFSEKNPATAGGGALPGGMGWYRKTFFYT